MPFYFLLQENYLPPGETNCQVGSRGTYTNPQGRLGKYISK